MNAAAKDTAFEGTIKCYGRQSFPDIVANKYYGVEVKSTTQNHWTTTGNSILESTRVKDVERIYMMFGKLATPIEFKCRPYEECLSEVIVTHSPRYAIDMELPTGETIFDKIQIPYDSLRLANPLEPILKYYRDKLQPGQQIWWLGSGSPSSLIIKFWNSLTPKERREISIKGFVYFPEIFSKKADKFNNMASWLVQKKNIVCPNMRDIYSAGGKDTLKVNGNTYVGMSRIIVNAVRELPSIAALINSKSLVSLSKLWHVQVTRKTALKRWADIVEKEVSNGAGDLTIKNLFNDCIISYGLI